MGAFKSKGIQATGVTATQSESVNLRPIATGGMFSVLYLKIEAIQPFTSLAI